MGVLQHVLFSCKKIKPYSCSCTAEYNFVLFDKSKQFDII